MSIGIFRLLCICLIYAFGVWSPAEGAAAESKETVSNAYWNNVRKAHFMEARVHYNIRRMYSRQINDALKEEMESVYGIPVEDQIYNITDQLYIKSFSQLEWDAVVDKQKMTGIQTHQGSYTQLTGQYPGGDQEQETSLRVLQAVPGFTYRFVLFSFHSKQQNSMMQLIMPAELYSWHYAPSMWYPSQSQIGFPEDLEMVEMRKNGLNEPYELSYTPSGIDPGIIEFISQYCKMPELSEADLTCVLTIEPHDYSCKGFAITMMVDGQKRIPLSITHIDLMKTRIGISVPSTTIFLTGSVVEKGGEKQWNSSNYFGQFNLQNIMIR